jgi:hypothetical protein
VAETDCERNVPLLRVPPGGVVVPPPQDLKFTSLKKS